MVEIIRKYDVGTQEELAERLREAGFPVTQATVSRDIRELKLSNVPTAEGGQTSVLLEQEEGERGDRYVRVLQDAYSSMAAAQNLLVIKTVSGMAMAVAAAIDAMRLKEIVGSIAGDDTIMMAVRTTDDTRIVMDKLHKMMDI